MWASDLHCLPERPFGQAEAVVPRSLSVPANCFLAGLRVLDVLAREVPFVVGGTRVPKGARLSL